MDTLVLIPQLSLEPRLTDTRKWMSGSGGFSTRRKPRDGSLTRGELRNQTMDEKVITVVAGTFTCDHCGRSWVGTWHGPREEMTCAWCEKPMHAQGIDFVEKPDE